MSDDDIPFSPRTVTWTEKAEVAIGYHRCSWCRIPTPDPTDSQLVKFAKNRPGSHFVWPFESQGYAGCFVPSGWTKRDDLELCPECTEAHDAAVAVAKVRRTP